VKELRGINYIGHVARIEEIINVYDLLVGIATGRRPFRRATNTCRHHININLYKIGCGSRDCIQPARIAEHWKAFVKIIKNL
jgi:hypothetical protein